MVFGMKRGFLNADRKESPVGRALERLDPPQCSMAQGDITDSTSNIRFQFSETCRLYSENPHIVLPDYRLPSASYFLFLPRQNADIVFVDSLEGVQSIAKWPLWDDPLPCPPSDPPFFIRASEDKGVGMFARRSIARGEIIMLERPVWVSHPTMNVHIDQKPKFYEAALAGLSPSTQASIARLHNAQPETADVCPIRGLLLTNALATKLPHTTQLFPALFPHLCRANHSCVPNAHYYFCTRTFAGRLCAMRAIAAGEEIMIGYTDLVAPRAQRQADLSARYRFACACTACSLPPASAAASDTRRQAIAAYFAAMRGPKLSFPEGASLARVRDLISWAEEEGLVEAASILEISGMRLAQRNGDYSEKLKFTVDAMSRVRALEGNDSPGFVAVAARVGLSVQQLASILDSGESIDYGLFERMLAADR
ncbi:hypothetical protein C8R44DRAFT_875099 [Mycena epipterygia]|nr:hypothetical protein C8R44DRAFT_875099 [Mycena epipterygia]